MDDKHIGDLVLREDMVVNGIVDGSVYVYTGKVVINGAIRKDVVVNGADATVEINGVVAGTVRVHAGMARVRGRAYDAVAMHPGVLLVDPEAIIGKR